MFARAKIIVFAVLALTVWSKAQAQDISIDLSRNLRNCLQGYTCNTALLSADEKVSVRSADLDRNRRNCLQGYTCNTALLSDDEKVSVRSADLDRNRSNCIRGYSCNRSMLAAGDKTAVDKSGANRDVLNIPTTVGAASAIIPRLGCAENGSCYGDLSDLTGRPKTVEVRGYFRRDGTYVRGHYRSRGR